MLVSIWVRKAMSLGVEQDRKETDLGVFGIGMKLSSLAQANQVTVLSIKDGKKSVRRIDATWIKENNENRIFKHHQAGSQVYETSYDKMVEEGWSTMVLLEDVHGERRFVTYDREREDALLDEMREGELKPNVISFNATLSACEKGTQWSCALVLVVLSSCLPQITNGRVSKGAPSPKLFWKAWLALLKLRKIRSRLPG